MINLLCTFQNIYSVMYENDITQFLSFGKYARNFKHKHFIFQDIKTLFLDNFLFIFVKLPCFGFVAKFALPMQNKNLFSAGEFIKKQKKKIFKIEYVI